MNGRKYMGNWGYNFTLITGKGPTLWELGIRTNSYTLFLLVPYFWPIAIWWNILYNLLKICSNTSNKSQYLSRRWFQRFVVFTPIHGRSNLIHIFISRVETTTQDFWRFLVLGGWGWGAGVRADIQANSETEVNSRCLDGMVYLGRSQLWHLLRYHWLSRSVFCDYCVMLCDVLF